MKTKVKLASILAALLLAACADPLSAPVGESAASGESGEHTVIFPADPNKGLVLLSVNGAPSAARVVLPDLSGATYSYRWYAETEDAAVPAEERRNSGDFTPDAASPLAIELEPARWTLAVRAWTGEAPAEDAEEPPAPAFAGRTELALGAGAAQSLTVGLLPNGEGSGTFSYDVSLPALTLGYAFISVFPLDGGDVVDVIDLKSAGTGTRALPSGYYNISTAVNYEDASTQKFAAKREVLYIYDGLTSSYAVTFAMDDFWPLLDRETGNVGERIHMFDNSTSQFEGIWPSLSSITALGSVVAALPQNTSDAPYLFALKNYVLDGTETADISKRLGNEADPLQDLFAVTQGRYVFYDLRACTGQSIPDVGDNQTFNIPLNLRQYKDRITGIILPESVTTIGKNVFNRSRSLAYVGLPSTLVEIGSYAFQDTSLAYVELPSGLTTWAGAFSGCTALASVVLSSGISSIPSAAFYACSSLVSINIPNTVTSIGLNAFNGTALASVDLPSGLTSLGNNTFRNCSSLTSIDIPDTVTTMGTNTFNGCTALASVVLPSNLKTLGTGAFQGCVSLAAIDIPEGVSTLAVTYLFDGCTSLKSITLRGTSMVTAFNNNNALTNVPITADDFHIYVPSSLVDTYKDNATWKTRLGADNIDRIIVAIPE